MPKNRPGRIHYTTATKAVNHGAPCVENGVVGVAIKQKASGATLGLSDVAHTQVAIGEQFAMIVKGIVEVDTVGGFAKGDAVYIIAATNVLTETASGNVSYGRVVEVAGERGLVSGKVRIDLDLKP